MKPQPLPAEMRKFKRLFHQQERAFFQTFKKNERATEEPACFAAKWSSATRKKLVDANALFMEVGMMINRCEGHARKASNVTNINAVFIDSDAAKLTKEHLLALPVVPHAIVETSPGNLHAYWLIKDCAVPMFRNVQKALARLLDTDPNVCDPNRVMRMPGTINWKRKKAFLARFVHLQDDPQPVSIKRFIKKMKLDIEIPERLRASTPGTSVKNQSVAHVMDAALRASVEAALHGLPADDRGLWQRIGMAIHNADPSDAGYELWTAWSRTSTKFNEPDQRERWAQFMNGGGITIHTLFWLANRIKQGSDAPLDEMSLAQLFADTFKDRLRYARDDKAWFHFTGVVWVKDAQAPLRLARSFIGTMTDDGKDDAANPLRRFRSNAGLRGIVSQAELLEELHIRQEQFDRMPHLFAVQNGVIDLSTGTFRAAIAADYLQRQARVAFDPDARCPLWDRFMRAVTRNDDELYEYIRRALGYTIIGHANAQVFFMPIGSGGNGKGVLMRTVQAVLGEYAQSVAPNLLTTAYSGNANGPTPALAKLYGARMVGCSELPTGRRLDEAFIKQYAGGDEITARSTYGSVFSFKPEGKLWLSTNEMPEILASDEAMWRRLKPIPFKANFRGDKRDDNLEGKLAQEYPGILNWLLKGARHFEKKGMDTCAAVEEVEAELRKNADSVLAWLSDCCMRSPKDAVPSSAAYDSYLAYMRTRGRKSISSSAFLTSLGGKGFQHLKRRNGNFFLGFRLQTS